MSLLNDLQKQREVDGVAMDAARNRLRAWQFAVSQVCRRIQELLDDLHGSGLVKFDQDSVYLTDSICKERYEADRLTLRFDSRRVVISATGDYCVGNNGRMDMTAGDGIGRYALIWVKLDGVPLDQEWFIARIEVTGKVGPRKPLSKESLQAALRELIGLRQPSVAPEGTR